MKLFLIAVILLLVIALVAVASLKPDNDTVNMEASQPVINGFTETVKAFFHGLWDFGRQQMSISLVVAGVFGGILQRSEHGEQVRRATLDATKTPKALRRQPETTIVTQWESVNRIGNDPLQDVAQQIKQSGK